MSAGGASVLKLCSESSDQRRAERRVDRERSPQRSDGSTQATPAQFFRRVRLDHPPADNYGPTGSGSLHRTSPLRVAVRLQRGSWVASDSLFCASDRRPGGESPAWPKPEAVVRGEARIVFATTGYVIECRMAPGEER